MKVVVEGKVYVFRKSGHLVRAIAPTTRYRGIPMWEVERVDGASAGKRMDVPERALLPEAELEACEHGSVCTV